MSMMTNLIEESFELKAEVRKLKAEIALSEAGVYDAIIIIDQIKSDGSADVGVEMLCDMATNKLLAKG